VIIEPRFSPDQSRQINDLTADGILAKDRLSHRDIGEGLAGYMALGSAVRSIGILLEGIAAPTCAAG